jgi:hypothetical protein
MILIGGFALSQRTPLYGIIPLVPSFDRLRVSKKRVARGGESGQKSTSCPPKKGDPNTRKRE